jgi:hypothetical protein
VLVDNVRLNRVGTDGDGLSDSLEGNLLSGNLARGLLIAADAEHNTVAGNYVGTDATGSTAVPNVQGGIELSNGARFNRIGTDADGQSDALERNVISGNTSHGITLFGSPPADDNVIAGNFIGLQADGVGPLGNSSHGIFMSSEANRNLVGGLAVTPGACDGPCNRIAYNGTGASIDGVRIAEGTENAIVGNVIYSSNAGAGIDIGSAGPTPNDSGDGDAGSNNSQNFPMLTQVITAGASTMIDGVLDSTPDTTFRLEFYANSVCDPNGYGEGEMLVGVHTVTTGSDGTTAFSAAVSPAVPSGHRVCSTATRLGPGGELTDTSEFSSCLGSGPAVAAGRVPDGLALPGTQLTIAKGGGNNLIFSWGDSCVGSDLDYAVYSGTIGDFASHQPRVCSTSGLTTRQAWIVDSAAYFLIVPLSATREGSYGTNSDGIDRSVGLDACHPQMVGECD